MIASNEVIIKSEPKAYYRSIGIKESSNGPNPLPISLPINNVKLAPIALSYPGYNSLIHTPKTQKRRKLEKQKNRYNQYLLEI